MHLASPAAEVYAPAGFEARIYRRFAEKPIHLCAFLGTHKYTSATQSSTHRSTLHKKAPGQLKDHPGAHCVYFSPASMERTSAWPIR